MIMRHDRLKAAERKRWTAFVETVVVERTKLSDAKWRPHFDRLRVDVRRFAHVLTRIGAEPADGDPEPRELLVWAWSVLMAAPENDKVHYARLRETSEDGGGLREEESAVRSRGYLWSGLDTLPEMRMRWLGGLVRAIDADMAGIEVWPRRPSEWRQEEWRPKGCPCFVVPVHREFRAGDHKERERRALLHHAIVPARLGGLEVLLKLQPDVDPHGGSRPWIYGAATFPGMTVDVRRIDADSFRLTGAPVPDEAGAVREHVRRALDAGCDVLVWPELTVPQGRLRLIKAELRGDPLEHARRIPLSVAGSWHVEEDGVLVNRTEVLHGKGRFLVHYDKRRDFVYDDRHEAISPGGRLVVIVGEDRLVGIAICKDFCDDCDDDVYDWLGVDLVLIPSMGADTTTMAQVRSAKVLQSRQGAVAFLVQQVPFETGMAPSRTEPPAYSLVSPPSPHGAAPSERQDEAFRPLRGRR